jgi:BirA family biotin operon repressor/biotin-[acetyl-CoA-carboxylase] ligase
MGFAGFLDELLGFQAGPARLPANLVVLPRIGSTNALGRRIARDYFVEGETPPPVLLVAWEQSAGRGRRGRVWSSPAGRGVYASLLLPVAGAERLHTLPLLAAVGLCRAAGRHLPAGGPRCRLKWPNDLLIVDDLRGGRKLGGLLIETERGEQGAAAAVIGFGVNHRPSTAVEIAAAGWGRGVAALAAESPEPPSLAELTRDLAASLLAELDHLGDEAYAAREYQALSAHRPGDVLRCLDGERTVEGVFLGFDRRGFLRLRPAAGEDGELRLAAGEVLA